ncbi:MAG: hypothetical protein AAF771_12650 [Pseudomonadota bacterium]
MKHLLAALAALAVSPAGAEDWPLLNGTEITEALTGAHLVSDPDVDAEQRFFASGRTEYVFGNPRWGWWEVRGDEYCSLWPPSDEWECYAVSRAPDGDAVRFIGAEGDVTEGAFEK